jgi:hypothetical protein
MSEKNINAIIDGINAEHAARPVPKPSITECTGCGVSFAETNSDEEDEDEDEKTYPDEVCDECGTIRYDLTVVHLAQIKDLPLGYIACESCACSHSRGSQLSHLFL